MKRFWKNKEEFGEKLLHGEGQVHSHAFEGQMSLYNLLPLNHLYPVWKIKCIEFNTIYLIHLNSFNSYLTHLIQMSLIKGGGDLKIWSYNLLYIWTK